MRERTGSPLGNIFAALVIAAFGLLGLHRSLQRSATRDAQRSSQQERLRLGDREMRRRRAALIKSHLAPVFEIPANLKQQGPVVVETGSDGGEDPSGEWNSPGEVASDDKSVSPFAVAGLAPSLQTNTLKCRFRAGAFSVPLGNAVRGVVISFHGHCSGGMGVPVVRVKSVKTSLGSANFADLACLTAEESCYTYGSPTDGVDSPVNASMVNGAWEIELAFDAPSSADFGNVHVRGVSAVVYFGPGPSQSAAVRPVDIKTLTGVPQTGELLQAFRRSELLKSYGLQTPL